MDKKHRRTSILKTDSNEATPTKTFGGKNKRISFSGKNSVKEFAGGNEKLTVWGTSYEKEMEALQKAGDTVSQVDITGVTSMLCNDTTTAVASNKENIGPTTSSTEKPRFSFALLGYEGGNVADGDRTMLHALPQENYSNENMEELFQIKSFLGQPNAQPFKKPQEPSFRASTTMMNETGMEVSMMWQDIMSQTKEATISTENKISPAMGKTIHYTGDENAMEISGAAVRGRVRETICEPKAMEVSRSVIVPREEYLRTTSLAGELSEVKNLNALENDPSRRRRETVFYEEGNDGIDQSMVNIPRTPHHDPPVGRNISPEDCHLEESIILDNITPYGHSKSTGSHSNNRTQNSGADMEMSTVHMERQSQYNFHQSIIQGGDAFVIDKENLNYIQGGDNSNRHRVGRETIHYQSEQADMDVSTKPIQFNKNRGTIHFPSDAGNMEESMVVNPVKSNYSMANSVVDKENLCQQRSTGAVKKTTSRQTIHFQGEEGGMDETIVNPPTQQIKNSRQTIVFQNENAGLDESNQFGGEKIFERGHERVEVHQQNLKPPRQTIHFNQTQGGMEESLLWDPIIPTEQSKDNYKIPRQTIHFNQTQGAMDESHVQMQITNNKNRQTIHFNQNEGNMDESLHPRNTRQTIYYAPEEANLDQSVATNQIQSQQPLQGVNKNRQTIHFNPNEGNMDESLLQIPVNKNRQTIHFNENAAMDESIQHPINPPAMSIKTKPSNPRETIVFNHRDGDMDQSVVQIPVITNNKNRQTIHFNPHEGDMDESHVQMPMINNKNRQTIHFNQNENQMDESLHPRNTRQTIYYAPEEGNLDQSVAVNQYQSKEANEPIKGVNKNRQTIHFNPNEGNMDESLLQIPVNNKTRQSAYLDQPPIAIPATKSYINKHRQTIHFNPNEGQMDESIAAQPLTGHVYYDENQMDMEEGPQKTPGKRGTIYFNPSEGAMDQSRMETTAQVTRPSEFVPPPQKVAKSRHTVYYQDENAGLDETRMLTEPVELPPRPVTRAQAKLRQTVYDRGEMEISMTMGDGFMGVDIKTNNFSEPTTVQQQKHQKQRQTVYYQDENAALDVSGVVPIDRNASNAMRRGTIHFNKNDNDGMEESMVMGGQTPKSNFKSEEARSINMQAEKSHPRQTIYFNNDQCGMDETLSGRATPTEQRTMGPLEWSMRQRANKSGMMNLTVQEALEMTINEKSRRNETIKGNKSSHMAMEQTMRLEEDIMEESVQMQKSQLRDCPGNVTRAQLDQDERHQSRAGKPRQTIYQVAEMEESMVVAGTSNQNNQTRRGTFNIPPPVSEEVKGGNTTAHLQRSTIMKNKTITSDVTTIPVCDSNLSDLNNSEDSIELIDSQDNARPVNNNKTRSNVSQRLSSPLLQDETVNDLILNFNMTGQFPGMMREEEEDDDVRHEEESEQIQLHKSRIPIAKVTRTPIKFNKSAIRSEAGRLDMSIVDTVCRDAAPVMPRSTFGRGGELEDMQKELTFVDGKKLQEMRMSIPAFAMGGEDLEDEVERMDNTKRQTMLEMKDLPEFEPEEVEMEEEEYQVEQGQRRRGPCSGQDSRLVRYRQLDSLLDKFNEIDFEEGRREITELRYLVDRVANATPVEQSLYLSKTLVEDKSLRETVLKEIKEKTEEGIRNLPDDRDWGCFPLCLPMEDMIKNLVESEHKQWRYQDLFYYVGLLKFRHRLIKTFQVVIKFELGDPEFAKEHYLPFERFQIIEEKDLSKWSTVDQRMHKELMRQMPVGLVSLYGSSNELGRFLSDVDRICKRIFLDVAK